MQADWQRTLECDAMIGNYYPVMPAHYVTTQVRIRNTEQCFEHICRATVSKSDKLLRLQSLHTRPTIIFFALKSYFYFDEKEGLHPALTIGSYIITASLGQYQKY